MPISFWARQDSGSANNPALNLTGADAVEITLVAEDASGGAGDLFLDQPSGGGVDPDTQISIGGTNYSFTYELSGTMPTKNSDGAQQVPDQFEGSGVVIITVQDYPAPGDTTRLAFMTEESATQAEMDSFGNGAIDIQAVNTTPSPTPVCFVRGTRIETKQGQVPIEHLSTGDLIRTMDNGYQPIRWIGSSIVAATGNRAPIRIAAGTLGNQRDLWVSSQHRMLLSGWQLDLLFAHSEVLVTAKSLVNDHSVRRVQGGQVEYFHMLFDTHQIVYAEGALSESFHPGVMALDAIGGETREEIFDLFPELRLNPAEYGQSARITLKAHEGALASRELLAG